MKTRLQSILLLRDDKQQEVTNDYLGEERHKLSEDCLPLFMVCKNWL